MSWLKKSPSRSASSAYDVAALKGDIWIRSRPPS